MRDTHLYFTANQSLAAIRQGDWKLFLAPPAAAGKGKKGKAAKNEKSEAVQPRPVLYNLATDPSETKDIAADNPGVVTRLKAEAERREAEIKGHRRPAGQLSSTQ